MTNKDSSPTAVPVFRHRTPVQLRFNDVDSFGHVNNSVYFALYDLAKTEYLRDVAGDVSLAHDVQPVVAHIDADFFYPVHYGDQIEIETAVTHLGRTSFVITQQAVNRPRNRVVCRCATTMVCFSAERGEPVPIPDEIKERFRLYEAAL